MSKVNSKNPLDSPSDTNVASTSGTVQLVGSLILTPINLLRTVVSSILTSLRPYAPQIVPVLVCTFFIPLILLLSAFAGFTVWSSLSVSWESPLHLQYGDGVPPYAHAIVASLHPQQRYDVSLHLLVPPSLSNLDLGNFMTSLTLSTFNNKTLTTVRRPAIVLPSPSRLFFPKSNAVKVHVPMLASFVAGTPKIVANVEIGRRDDWKSLGSGQGRELSVLHASLQGLAVPHGVRGLAIRFPLASAFISASAFLTILSLILGTCVLPAMLPSPASDTSDGGNELLSKKTETALSELPAYDSDNKPRRRRRSRPSRGTSDTIQSKGETPIATIPGSEVSASERLRRRQSSSRRGNQADSDLDT